MNEKCFALRKQLKCAATCYERCIGYLNCPLHKPIWKQEESIQKSYQRFNQMPLYEQMAIADKYYRGKMPWRDSE